MRGQTPSIPAIGNKPPTEQDIGPIVDSSLTSLGELSDRLDYIPADAEPPSPARTQAAVTRDDLVVAIPTSVKRYSLTH